MNTDNKNGTSSHSIANPMVPIMPTITPPITISSNNISYPPTTIPLSDYHMAYIECILNIVNTLIQSKTHVLVLYNTHVQHNNYSNFPGRLHTCYNLLPA